MRTRNLYQAFVIIAVSVVVSVLFMAGSYFVSAQWAAPSTPPPGGNTSAPINIGGLYQQKNGDVGALRVRANEYCDLAGVVCSSTIGGDGGLGPVRTYGPVGYTDTSTFNLGPQLFCSLGNVGNLEDSHYCKVWQNGDNWYMQQYKSNCQVNCIGVPGAAQGNYRWVTGQWSAWTTVQADGCGNTHESRTRTVQCQTQDGQAVSYIHCSGERPVSSQTRNYRWGGGCT